MKKTNCYMVAVVLGSLFLAVVEGSSLHENVIRRWRRQVHCQPDDEACQRCSSSCSTVSSSHLPECCEAYNACCDEYFQACKKCSNVASKDRYFPEYCCASFTDCCDLITTFTTQVKSPAPVRESKKSSLSDLKIPEVAAPKPSAFPGGAQNSFQESAVFEESPAFIKSPQEPAFDPQDSVFAPQTHQVVRTQEPAPAFAASAPRQRRPQPPAFATETSLGAAPEDSDISQRQVTRTQARAQVRPQTRSKQQQQTARRPQHQDDLDLSARRGRVTSRGRVAA